jgi:hypothetical protein
MKRLIPIPSHSVNRLKRDKETGLGYQAVSVQLRDGRHFDQAIASEGCIIAVRGYGDVPFTHDEVEYVAVNHKRWNFRENSDVRRNREKSRPGEVISGGDMRKRQIRAILQSAESSDRAWLDLADDALIEVTSEEKAHPIESALLLHEPESCGWLAANPGTQVIRIIFDEPHMLRRIWLVFEDAENTRTQEFVLRWSPGIGQAFREIVRQQWNFSPSGSTREIEDYTVDLPGAVILELMVVPDKDNGQARASLSSLRLA